MKDRAMKVDPFNRFDTQQPNSIHVKFDRVIESDEFAIPDDFDCYTEQDNKAWLEGKWKFIGVRARAIITIIMNGTGTYYTIESPGLWGIESDTPAERLDEIYEEECDILKTHLRKFKDITF